MIVDAHLHLTGHGWVKSSYMASRGGVWSRWVGDYNRQHGTKLTLDEYVAILRKTAASPDGSIQLKRMDVAGIDHAIIFGVDWSLMTGEPRVTQQEQNKAHAAAMKAHPDRFTALASLDLRRGNLMDLAKECIEDWGMRGFYIMPAAGFCADNPAYRPFFEKCVEWKVPVNIHCGAEIHHLEYNHPIHAATVAIEYGRDGRLTVLIGHAGTEIFKREATSAASLRNVYLEFGGPDPSNPVGLERWYRDLRWRMDEVGADKLMLGSGVSAQETVPMDECIKAIKEPKTKIKFTKKELEAYLGKTAQAVFKIKG